MDGPNNGGLKYRDDESARLFLAWRDGDHRAFNRLYARWKVPLLRWIVRLDGNALRAEEICQEVWMTVIRQRETYEPRAAFGTWLFGVARSRWIDATRKAGRRPPSTAMDQDQLEISDDDADIFATAVLNQYLDVYCQCLPGLPVEQREAFLLRTQQDMEWIDIGIITRSSAETARSRFRYASAKLKGCMGLS